MGLTTRRSLVQVQVAPLFIYHIPLRIRNNELEPKNGTTVWRAVVRIKVYPSVCNHFERKQKAEDWAQDTE